MGNNNRRLASLNARLVVCCETIAQLRGAMLVRPKVAEKSPGRRDERKTNGAGNSVGCPASRHVWEQRISQRQELH